MHSEHESGPEIPAGYKEIPQLSDEVNKNFVESEIEGGARLDKLPVGASLKVQTKHTSYLIEKREDGYYISGNEKYCPTPTLTNITGSTWGGNMLKTDFVGRGMLLEYYIGGTKITTSKIDTIEEIPAAESPEASQEQ